MRNGLALTGTLHWMFDRGLLSVAEDWTILVSRNKVPSEVVDRLILPDGKLRLPKDGHHWPHPDNLRWRQKFPARVVLPETSFSCRSRV